MKFTADKKLAEVFSLMAGHRSKLSTSTSNLAYMELDGNMLTLRGTDFVVHVEARVVVIGKEDGDGLIDPTLMSEILSTMDTGDITFSGKKRLNIKQGNKRRSAALAITDDFPDVPKTGSELNVTLPTGELLAALDSVEFARAQGKDAASRPILGGLNLDFSSGSVMAGDGTKAAIARIPTSEQGSILMASEGFTALKSALCVFPSGEVCITATPPGWIKCEGDGFTLYIGSVDGAYPDIEGFVNDVTSQPNVTEAIIETSLLTPILKVAEALTRSRGYSTGRSINITVANGTVIFQLSTEDGGINDTIEAETTGDERSVRLVPSQLRAAIQKAPLDRASLKIWGPDKEGKARPVLLESGDWRVLIAPMFGDKDYQPIDVEEDDGDF